VVSGYAGGEMPNPTYHQVCSGRTGHAEVVQITFDPEVVSFRDILDIFFTIHDPTTLNRQGADVGTQYRSVVFYHDQSQKEAAETAIQQFESEGVWSDRIVTQLEPAPDFFPAEEYHQRYYERNPNQGYCQAVIAPKLAKLRKKHFERLVRKAEPRGIEVVPEMRTWGPSPGGSSDPFGPDQERGVSGGGQVRPYQGQPGNPMDQGGIAD
jgi:peptide-methionine (S)-S-oxide reductase